jgi:Leucine-rich repeat (LRR) protein
LKIKELYLKDSSIDSLGYITELKELTKLTIDDCPRITNLSLLPELTSLTYLHCGNKDQKLYLMPLIKMTSLISITIHKDDDVVDLDLFLENAPKNLERVIFRETRIKYIRFGEGWIKRNL